jgi:hypothetical protein
MQFCWNREDDIRGKGEERANLMGAVRHNIIKNVLKRIKKYGFFKIFDIFFFFFRFFLFIIFKNEFLLYNYQTFIMLLLV